MSLRCLLLPLLLVLAPACQFDGSSTLDENLEELGDPAAPDQSGDQLPPAELLATYWASGESTLDGMKVSGSYVDLRAMDGATEFIIAEIDSRDEELEQEWDLGIVPAGDFELTFVAQGYSPLEGETFTLSYRLGGSGAWTNLVTFASADALALYLNDLSMPSTTQLELRARLQSDAPVVKYDDGEYELWEFGNGGGGISIGIGSKSPEPYRSLRIDQLVLTAKPGSDLGN